MTNCLSFLYKPIIFFLDHLGYAGCDRKDCPYIYIFQNWRPFTLKKVPSLAICPMVHWLVPSFCNKGQMGMVSSIEGHMCRPTSWKKGPENRTVRPNKANTFSTLYMSSCVSLSSELTQQIKRGAQARDWLHHMWYHISIAQSIAWDPKIVGPIGHQYHKSSWSSWSYPPHPKCTIGLYNFLREF